MSDRVCQWCYTVLPCDHHLKCMCKQTRYCNETCQRADWRSLVIPHKLVCPFRYWKQVVALVLKKIPEKARLAVALYIKYYN